MADKKELDRVNHVADLINRYYQFEDAVDVNKQNIEYLKTYIHDGDYVEQNFDMKSKFLRDIAISAGVAVVAFAVGLIFTNLIISGIIGVVALIVCIIVFKAIATARLNAKKQEQVEVNTGITEQIQALEKRTKQMEKQRDDYKKGLESRLDFLSVQIPARTLLHCSSRT